MKNGYQKCGGRERHMLSHTEEGETHRMAGRNGGGVEAVLPPLPSLNTFFKNT